MGDSAAGLAASAAARYLRHAATLVEDILAAELAAIHAAAELCADAVAGGGLVHVLGTGHSHMLAEELFYRAGGLAAVDPILDERLMVHVSALESTRLERLATTGDEVLAAVAFAPGDVLVVASNSGGNAVCRVVAARAKALGVGVIAVVSEAHAAAVVDEADENVPSLLVTADVVIDNHGAVGDASIGIASVHQPVGPTSTVTGAAIVNAIVADTVELLATRGVEVGVLASSNVPGGEAHNDTLLAPFRGRVRAL